MKKQKLGSAFTLIVSLMLVGNTAFAIETEYQEESRTEESSTEEETDTEESSTEEETDTEESSTEEETTTERTTEKETDTKEDTPEKEIEIKEMYRLYNPNNGEHFYTADINEKNHLVNAGWNYEGIAWNAPAEGNPVYRLYNPNVGDHFYTLDVNERNHLVDVGWNYEGIGWYSDKEKEVPVYRLYNPNAVTGTHHYTLNYLEVENLQSLGWKYEGIAWYSSDDIFVDNGNNGEKKEYIEISNVNENNGTFDVTVYMARSQSQISIVYVPVWTKSDQSDIYWYVAEKQSNGIYKVTVDATNHQWNSGKYYVHVYVRDLLENMNFVSDASVNVQLKESTIGKQKVDKYTAQILAEVNNKLYGSYLWCVNSITYKTLPIPMPIPSGYTDDQYYAVYAYENRQGNCYCYAAAFYQLAIKLGYDADFIQGEVGMRTGGTGPHAWVEIHVNGGTYVCDPDAQYETGRNAYMVTYTTAPFVYYK